MTLPRMTPHTGPKRNFGPIGAAISLQTATWNASKPVYSNLLQLVEGKNYFVLTTNVDYCFQKAGVEKKRLFYTQGDYGLFQCSEPCCQETYDNEATIRAMMKQQGGMRVPNRVLPCCLQCGKPMTMNL